MKRQMVSPIFQHFAGFFPDPRPSPAIPIPALKRQGSHDTKTLVSLDLIAVILRCTAWNTAKRSENMTTDTPDIATNSPPTRAASTRSRVSNGADLFIAPADGRSREARRFRDVFGDMLGHLGGDDRVSEPRRHLAKRATALIVWCETVEARLAAGEELDVAPYTTAINSLRRLLTDLGLDPAVRDVTPTLTDYLRERAE